MNKGGFEDCDGEMMINNLLLRKVNNNYYSHLFSSLFS